MIIKIPTDIEKAISAEVACGHFASVDEAMTEAARLLLRELRFKRPSLSAAPSTEPHDPLLGSMREFADEMDEIVAEAYRHRREDQGRKFDL